MRLADRPQRSTSDKPCRRVARDDHRPRAGQEVIIVIPEADCLPSGDALAREPEARIIRPVHGTGNRPRPRDVRKQRAVVVIGCAHAVWHRDRGELTRRRVVTVARRAATSRHGLELAGRSVVARRDGVAIGARDVDHLAIEVVIGVRRAQLAHVGRRVVGFLVSRCEDKDVCRPSRRRHRRCVAVGVVADADHASIRQRSTCRPTR